MTNSNKATFGLSARAIDASEFANIHEPANVSSATTTAALARS